MKMMQKTSHNMQKGETTMEFSAILPIPPVKED